MSTNAIISKDCDQGFVYLVPGRIAMNDHATFSGPPAEEEIVIDAMPAQGVDTAVYINPSIKMTLLEPDGCEFLLPDRDLQPNDIVYNFPIEDDHSIIKASVNSNVPEEINRGNSRSFRFAIKGRAGREIKLGVVVTAQPVSVQVNSCNWTIDQLDLDTVNLGGPLDDLEA